MENHRFVSVRNSSISITSTPKKKKKKKKISTLQGRTIVSLSGKNAGAMEFEEMGNGARKSHLQRWQSYRRVYGKLKPRRADRKVASSSSRARQRGEERDREPADL